MTELSENKRDEILIGLEDALSSRRDAISISRQDLLAAIVALDTFMNDNAISLNNSLPEASKMNLTTDQKAELLKFVITKRFQEGS